MLDSDKINYNRLITFFCGSLEFSAVDFILGSPHESLFVPLSEFFCAPLHCDLQIILLNAPSSSIISCLRRISISGVQTHRGLVRLMLPSKHIPSDADN